MNSSPRAPSLRSEHVPKPGDVVGAKYRVERVLAIGGMGAVLAASHVELGQRVAVKVMLPGLLDRPEFAARFFREGRAAALLRSEHAARVFDFGRLDDGVPYLVMELLDGLDLEKLVRQRGPLPVEEAVGYIVQACDAIAEAHAHGIVHRDVKPSNLFVVRGRGAPSVKVLDFGISKSMQQDAEDWEGSGLTATEATLGSPAYMSPEQLRSAKGVDGRTDLWSLGLVLHWLLTARLAFESDSLAAHLAMVVNHPPTPLRVRRPDAPAAVEEAILRCLQKDLSRRFQSAGQLALALAPFTPPWVRDIVPRVVARGGEADAEAASALPPLEQTTTGSRPLLVPGAATQAAWTPFATQAPRRGLWLSLQAGALLAAVLLGITAQRLLGAEPAPPPAEGAPAEATAAQATTAGAPATGAPAAPEAPPPEAVPGEVAIQLVLDPPGATVEVDGVLTLDNPVRLRRGAEVHRIVVSAPGHAPEAREVSAKADAELRVSLRRQESGPSRPPPQPPPQPPPEPPTKPPAKKLKGPMETEL